MSLVETVRTLLDEPPAAPMLEGDLPELRADAATPAAVLVALTDRAEPGVVLTVRREHMRTHAGQIAFPGGRIDPGESPVEAALREAQEELLLDPAKVEVAGEIDPYQTVTGYVVTPVVGVVPPDLPLTPYEQEVADWFEAPLGFLLHRANHQQHSGLYRGEQRHYYEINWEGRRIWGATAAMIINLSRRLRWR